VQVRRALEVFRGHAQVWPHARQQARQQSPRSVAARSSVAAARAVSFYGRVYRFNHGHGCHYEKLAEAPAAERGVDSNAGHVLVSRVKVTSTSSSTRGRIKDHTPDACTNQQVNRKVVMSSIQCAGRTMMTQLTIKAKSI